MFSSFINDSPFIRSDWDSGVTYIRKGNETLKLDFSDSQNPRRTVGGPVTPEFPAGTYHYFATDSYPFLQRCVKGTVTTTGGGTPPPRG